MKIPTTAAYANLRFTHSGQVWADFILQGLEYGLRADKEKQNVRQLHQALFQALPGESLLLGLCSTLDPTQVVEQMLGELDPSTCPDWIAECEATLASVEQLRPGMRIFWLSVPLQVTQEAWKLRFTAAAHSLFSRLALPVSAPSREVLQALQHQADLVLGCIPVPFRAAPATPAQMVWLHQHMIDRGLFLDDLLPRAEAANPKRGCAFSAPALDEGGTSDVAARAVVNLLKRRWLKVQSTSPGDEDVASYQSMLMVANVPDGEVAFPGGEIIGRIDGSGLTVDWALRLTVRASEDVLRTNQRALATLNEQYNQRDGEVSHGLSALDRAAEDLAEYAALLESNKLEVECQVTVVFAVAAADPDTVHDLARTLASWCAQWGYKLAQPLGYQEAMWWAMQPGVPTDPIIREYAQLTTSGGLASLVPLATANVGDSTGTLLAINTNNGPMLDEHTPCGPSPLIFHDPDGATDRNVSGSMAAVGDLGSGKSFLLKKEAGSILDRGGRIIVTDRTKMGEWAQWAGALTDPRIVNALDPQWSLDPLRLFDPATGARAAQSFLTPLLNIQPTSERGVILSEVLDAEYLQRHQINGLGALVDHLATTCEIDGAKGLAGVMRVFARKDLGRVVFDSTLPALDVRHAAIVFHTHGLVLPKREEIEHQHLFEQMGLEKKFGRALFALISSIARHECFEDRDRLAAFIVDEAHAVTSSPEAVNEITDFIRDGRKHRAVVLLGSHDPDEDFPSETLRGLIPWRIVMRHTDKQLAINALRWIGLDPDDDLVDMVTKDLSPELGGHVPAHRRGECLIRDSSGAIGRGRILPPAIHSRDQAARTGGRQDRVAA